MKGGYFASKEITKQNNLFMKYVGYLFSLGFSFLYKFVISPIKLSMFGSRGRKCRVNRNSIFKSPSNIYIGNNVNIGINALFYSTIAKIIIGDNVMIGPNVSLITGDHRIDILDKPMIECVIKSSGTVIGANSFVLKSTESNGVYFGNSAKLVRKRDEKV